MKKKEVIIIKRDILLAYLYHVKSVPKDLFSTVKETQEKKEQQHINGCGDIINNRASNNVKN